MSYFSVPYKLFVIILVLFTKHVVTEPLGTVPTEFLFQLLHFFMTYLQIKYFCPTETQT